MKFTTYADVLTPEHPMSKAYTDGHKKNPGTLLGDLLRQNNGRYEVTFELPQGFLDNLRLLAETLADDRLAAQADQPRVTISLEHLRKYDPRSTRIVYGCRLDREPGDDALPGFDR